LTVEDKEEPDYCLAGPKNAQHTPVINKRKPSLPQQHILFFRQNRRIYIIKDQHGTLSYMPKANFLSIIMMILSIIIYLSTFAVGYHSFPKTKDQINISLTQSHYRLKFREDDGFFRGHDHIPVLISFNTTQMLFPTIFSPRNDFKEWNVTAQPCKVSRTHIENIRHTMKQSESILFEGNVVYTQQDFNDDYATVEHDYIIEYFAFDDDEIRYDNCRRNSWHFEHQPVCNHIHEVGFLQSFQQERQQYDHGSEEASGDHYVASGSYRDTFSIYNGEAILKIGKLLDFESLPPHELWEMIRIDALVRIDAFSALASVSFFSCCC